MIENWIITWHDGSQAVSNSFDAVTKVFDDHLKTCNNGCTVRRRCSGYWWVGNNPDPHAAYMKAVKH